MKYFISNLDADAANANQVESAMTDKAATVKRPCDLIWTNKANGLSFYSNTISKFFVSLVIICLVRVDFQFEVPTKVTTVIEALILKVFCMCVCSVAVRLCLRSRGSSR